MPTWVVLLICRNTKVATWTLVKSELEPSDAYFLELYIPCGYFKLSEPLATAFKTLTFDQNVDISISKTNN